MLVISTVQPTGKLGRLPAYGAYSLAGFLVVLVIVLLVGYTRMRLRDMLGEAGITGERPTAFHALVEFQFHHWLV